MVRFEHWGANHRLCWWHQKLSRFRETLLTETHYEPRRWQRCLEKSSCYPYTSSITAISAFILQNSTSGLCLNVTNQVALTAVSFLSTDHHDHNYYWIIMFFIAENIDKQTSVNKNDVNESLKTMMSRKVYLYVAVNETSREASSNLTCQNFIKIFLGYVAVMMLSDMPSAMRIITGDCLKS